MQLSDADYGPKRLVHYGVLSFSQITPLEINYFPQQGNLKLIWIVYVFSLDLIDSTAVHVCGELNNNYLINITLLQLSHGKYIFIQAVIGLNLILSHLLLVPY